MRLHIAAIGKLKTGPEKMLASDYAFRIETFGKKAGVTSLKIGEWQESQQPSPKQRMEEEAKKRKKYVVGLPFKKLCHRVILMACTIISSAITYLQ